MCEPLALYVQAGVTPPVGCGVLQPAHDGTVYLHRVAVRRPHADPTPLTRAVLCAEDDSVAVQ